MFNDESNRSGQGQSSFVPRRPIPKYNGDKSGGNGYQSQGGYSSGGYNNGGYSGGADRQHSGGQSSYSSPQRRRDSGGYGADRGERGGSGGYQRSYGYNRNNSHGGNNDRLIRQNDIIIKLLKDIRDRLPAPPGMAADSDGYGTENSYSGASYSGSSYRTDPAEDADAEFDISAAAQERDDANGDVDDDEADRYNS